MKTNLKALFIVSAVFLNFLLHAQNNDSLIVRKIFETALVSDTGYENLYYLTKKIGPRLAGTPQSLAAVDWAFHEMKNLGNDTVYLQETQVIRWIRGDVETFNITSAKFGELKTKMCALGGSVGTPKGGISSEIVEVQNFDELKTLGEKNIKGKIVFFNRAMDPKEIFTFYAYGKAADQRVNGASEAAKYGAVGVIIRSLSIGNNDFPHTGIMRYEDNIAKIPCAAISTNDAEILSKWLKQDTSLKVFFEMYCKYDGEAKSYNVIGEIKGSEKPNEIITVGGHLDSWDITPGANDDGAGCIHSMDVSRIFRDLKIRPKHTVRIVLFMDEEFAQRGGATYAESVKNKNEKILIAIESDEGGSMPIGFSVDANDTIVKAVQQWEPILKPYGLYELKKGWGGVDIGPLKKFGIPLIGLTINSQRYFDYHHAPNDTFETVSKRELQMGCGSVAAIIYLLDKYEFEIK